MFFTRKTRTLFSPTVIFFLRLISPVCSTLINTSGSGKTRILLEGLCHRWGFYYTCLDGDGIGSNDLANALKAFQSTAGFSDIPDTAPPDEDTVILREKQIRNGLLASQYIQAVTLSRLLLFHAYLEALCDADVSITNEHKRRWLYLQVTPSAFFHNQKDAFALLSAKLWRMTASELEDRLDVVQTKIGKI
jgi:hypothetical protein